MGRSAFKSLQRRSSTTEALSLLVGGDVTAEEVEVPRQEVPRLGAALGVVAKVRLRERASEHASTRGPRRRAVLTVRATRERRARVRRACMWVVSWR